MKKVLFFVVCVGIASARVAHADLACGSSSTTYTCMAGYYGSISCSSSTLPANCNQTCTPCPSDSVNGWYVTSAEGSTSITSCYASGRPTNCSSGYVRVYYNSSTSKYDRNPTVTSTLVAKKGYYAASGATTCTKCPDAGSSYTSSALSSLANGTTSGTGSTALTSCYLTGGSSNYYYNSVGKFTVTSGNCAYSSSATSNLR